MSVMVCTTRVDHRYLMNKSKSDIADMYMRLLDETEKDERDAARYRALRDQNVADSPLWKLQTPEAQTTFRSLLHGEELDAAVDRLRGVVP